MEASVVSGEYDYRNIIIPSTVDYNGRSFSVTGIGERAFDGSKVQTILIPHSVKYIAQGAFNSNKYLKNLVIPNSIVRIETSNFIEVQDSLIFEDGEETLVINEGYAEKITFISRFVAKYLYVGRNLWGDGIFSDYPSISVSLSTVDILEYGDNIVKMLPVYHYNFWNGTFRGTFHTLILGKKIEYLESMNQNENLKTIICKMQNPIGFDKEYFSTQQYMNVEVHIPQGSLTQYTNSEGWKYFFVYKEEQALGLQNIEAEKTNKGIWTLGGMKVREGFQKHNGSKGDIYIIDGKKAIVK